MRRFQFDRKGFIEETAAKIEALKARRHFAIDNPEDYSSDDVAKMSREITALRKDIVGELQPEELMDLAKADFNAEDAGEILRKDVEPELKKSTPEDEEFNKAYWADYNESRQHYNYCTVTKGFAHLDPSASVGVRESSDTFEKLVPAPSSKGPPPLAAFRDVEFNHRRD